MIGTLIIANPAAGRGRGNARLAELRRLCERAGGPFEFHSTTGPGDARRTARAAARKFARVVGFGGDGTFGEVAGGLAEARLAAEIGDIGPFAALGLLPGGTGNDLCLATGVSKNLGEAFATLCTERIRQLDMGRIRWRVAGEETTRERLFANNVGLGFEGQVGYRAAGIQLPVRGVALYLLALLAEIGKLVNPDLRLRFGDGEARSGRMLLVSVGNGPSSGGGFLLNPEADPFDGQLDFCVVDARGRFEVFRLIPRAMQGKHSNLPGVLSRRGTHLSLESETPFHGHVDGELLGDNIVGVEIELLPGLLPIIC